MGKTRHVGKRMSQRGIRQSLIDLTLGFGVKTKNGRVVLNKQGLEELLEQLKDMEQTVQEALKKGGIVLVCDEEVLVTTYRVDSYHRQTTKNRSLS